MSDSTSGEQCVRSITEHQSRLFGYLVTLLGNVHDAHDVLQQTNLVIWRKYADEFEEGSDFGAWARKCAYFQALAYVRDRKRDRHVFDDDLVRRLASEPETELEEDPEARELALRDCLSQLPEEQRRLIAQRYTLGGAVRELARMSGQTESAIKMKLMRIRQVLLECVERKLNLEMER